MTDSVDTINLLAPTMSAETKAALESAIAAHIADATDGNILTDWGMVTASTTMEDIGSGATVYRFDCNDGQPAHVSYGLMSYALQSSVWEEED